MATPGIGIDCGISLTKLASADASGKMDYRSGSAEEILQSLADFRRLIPAANGRLTVTGARARAFTQGLEREGWVTQRSSVHWVSEFEAWAAGARALLQEAGSTVGDPFLLVSLGTGTSLLRVTRASVERVGGCALGGGSVVGLGRALVGTRDFKTLCELATRGERGRVDLRLGDVYPDDEIALPAGAVAAHFGKLALEDLPPLQGGREIERSADLIRALFGLVADNVGLLAASHARRLGLRHCVVAGSPLENNPCLYEPLETMLVAHGLDVTPLRHGAYAGARGALVLAP